MKRSQARFGVVATTLALTAVMVLQAHAANFTVTSAVMAKKYANGKSTGVTRTFKPSDRTIYCVLRLNRILRNVKVRFVWTAVNVKGIRANEKFLDKSGTLKAADIVYGSAALPKNWPTGSYKVDVYINGAKTRTLAYSVRA